MLGDAVPVHHAAREALEDQHVERAREEILPVYVPQNVR